MVPQKDIAGKKYGRLTAVKWVRNQKHITLAGREVYYNFWEFICDCGKIKILRKSAVTYGKGTKSCGCTRGQHIWKGHGNISGSHWGAIKKSARIRNIKFSISIKQAWKLYEQQNGKCKLSGVAIPFNNACGQKWYAGTSASLDRIDSKKGYIKGNVQWIHKDLNTMKWDYTSEKFIAWCTKVHQHNTKGD